MLDCSKKTGYIQKPRLPGNGQLVQKESDTAPNQRNFVVLPEIPDQDQALSEDPDNNFKMC